MPIGGPFYFAWVDETETSFNSSHFRMDEYLFSAKRTLSEGEKPLLEIEIQNPHTGILSSGRKYWAWFSWFNGSSIVPLFFGRVVGSPTTIFEEVIMLQLVGDPVDYIARVQAVAETMKVRPFYDPVFIDVMHRDDPNTVLEGYTKVWDVDPVTHNVIANDIIIGVDGNEDFTEADHFYDSMSMSIGQPPATAILMDASVSWNQTSRGTVFIGNYNFPSLSNSIISEWPKPLSQLGAGWSVYDAEAYDTAGVAEAFTYTVSSSFINKEKHHEDGDCMSANSSATIVVGPVRSSQRISFTQQIGVQDAFSVDSDGEPSPTNIPASNSESFAYILGYEIFGTLTLQYDALRPRTERVIFLVRADTQPVLTHPQTSEESETITKSGVDVGTPIINLLDWTTIAGTSVALGTVIFPDNPSIPGGQAAQICVVPGTAGLVEPDFSDIPGFTTVDGTVTWSSMGGSTPTSNAKDWAANTFINLGDIILPQRPNTITLNDLMSPGLHTFPQSDVNVSEGTIVQWTDGSFEVCIIGGELGPVGTTAVFHELASLPSGHSYFICTTAGVSGPQYFIPPFNETLHATTNDNGVVWTCIGVGEIPAGGYPGEVHAATYFATDRGRESIEYLGSLCRAKLLYRARCIEIGFESDYLRGTTLTTRKTVTLHDPRIAGGTALGKVKSAVLSVADTGIAGCQVTIACCAGLGNAVTEYPGDPTYVVVGYVDGYQKLDNVVVVLPGATDLSYTPPAYVSADDGLTFPLTRAQVVLVDMFHAGNPAAAGQALDALAKAAQINAQPIGTEWMAEAKQQQLAALSGSSLDNLLKADPDWQEWQFKPVNSGPFHNVYTVKFSNLQVPKGIDLQSDIIS